MNASNVDQALTSPVALRRNSAGLCAVPIVVSAMFPLLTSLSVDQLVALDAFFGIELDDRSHEHPLLIRAARIDGQRLAELHRALALVDVPVQRQQRLMLLDRLPDGRRSNRPERPAAVEQLEVRIYGGRLVEA